jgi:uncharacterized protein (DUF2236 family)
MNVDLAGELPGPRSITRRRSSDVRLLGAGGYALALQVAHPAIAGGVRDHSNYASEPWARLFRTTDYLTLLLYGPPATVAAVADTLRHKHRDIRGTDPEGRRYHALEPSAFAWVHATLAEAIVRGHDLFGSPLTFDERQRFWDEWRALGRVLGVRDQDLPSSWPAFQRYLAAMIDDVLEDNDVVQDVVRAADHPVGGSPFGWLDDRVWAVAGLPLARYMKLLSVGMMPPALRSRLQLPWSARQQAAFSVLAAANRTAGHALPRVLRQSGPLALRLRRAEIARGPWGSAA